MSFVSACCDGVDENSHGQFGCIQTGPGFTGVGDDANQGNLAFYPQLKLKH